MLIKKLLFFLLIYFLIILCQAFAQEQKSLKESSIKYASVQAAKEAVDLIKNKQISIVVLGCKKHILDPQNIHNHQGIENSKKLTKEYTGILLSNQFEENLSIIYDSLNIRDVFSKGQYIETVKNIFAKEIKENKTVFIEKNFDNIFSAARLQAVTEQGNDLILSAYPSQVEVEKADISSSWETLKEQLKGQIGKRIENRTTKKIDEVIFNENIKILSGAVKKVIDNIELQLQEQQKSLEYYVDKSAIEEIEIVNRLNENIQQSINRMKSNSGKEQIIYNIFPSIKEKIIPKAKEIVKKRFKLFIKNFDFSVHIGTLKDTIQDKRDEHRLYINSLSSFGEILFPVAVEEVINEYSAEGSQTFNSTLKQLVTSSEEIKNCIAAEIKGALQMPLRKARQDIAELQVQKHFYPVFSGEWSVPEISLKKIALKKLDIHNFEKCLTLPFISKGSKPYKKKYLLEETENEVLKKTLKLLAEGERAWNAQLSIVKGKEDEIRNKLLENIDTKNEEQWVLYYTEQVEKDWSEKRYEKIWRGFSVQPTNSATKYTPLFDYTKQEIIKIVHNYFNIIEKKIKRLEQEKESINMQPKVVKVGGPRREKEMGIASAGGEKSIKDKESGGGSQVHPLKVGKRKAEKEIDEKTVKPQFQWLLLLLLILIIVLFLLVCFLLWHKNVYFDVNDLNIKAKYFSDISGLQPVKEADTKVVFKKGFNKIIFRSKDSEEKTKTI